MRGSLSGGVETALGKGSIPTKLKVMQEIVELEEEKIPENPKPTSTRAPGPREDSEDETTVAEQLLFLSLRGGAVLIGRTLLNFCFWY